MACSSFPTNIIMLFSQTCYMPSLSDIREGHELRSSSLRSFASIQSKYSTVTSSYFGPNIHFRTLFVLFRSKYPLQYIIRLISVQISTSVHYSPKISSYKFLGAFANLRKTTISFFMSVCSHGTVRLPLGLS